MATPSLRQPTWDDVHAIVRRCRLPPESAKGLGQALAALVPEIKAEIAVPEAERRARRRKEVSVLKAFAVACRRVVDVFGTDRPAWTTSPHGALGRDIGLLFSADASTLSLDLSIWSDLRLPDRSDLPVSPGLPVRPTLSPHELGSEAATSQWLIRCSYRIGSMAEDGSHQEPVSEYGDNRIVTMIKRLTERSEAELEAERANTGGRPADRARRVALVRLLHLHERLTRRPAPSWPSEAFRGFAQSCFAAIGSPTEGLQPAVDRLFDRIRKSREAPT